MTEASTFMEITARVFEYLEDRIATIQPRQPHHHEEVKGLLRELRTSSTSAQAAPASDAGFSSAMALLAIAVNPQAVQQRLDAIMAATTMLEATKSEAEAAQSALVEEATRQRAASDKREAALDACEKRLAEREHAVEETWAKIEGAFTDARRMDAQMRRAVTTYSLEHFDERLQTLPNWEQLHESIFGRPDPHFGGNDEQSEVLTESVPEAVAGATLTRSQPGKRRGIERRVTT